MKWLALALFLAGCGGEVTAKGMVDDSGCPVDPTDVNGTATTSPPACVASAESVSVAGGAVGGTPVMVDGKPIAYPVQMTFNAASQSCTLAFEILFANGCDGLYTLSMPAR